jgi:broad specificity phosphatase PhoE
MNRDTRTLYLIRHGATEANLRRPYVLQGQRIDLPLCDIGRRQAEAAAQALGAHVIDHVYSSPLQRACETASMIARSRGLEVKLVDHLIECDVGRWEGLSWEEIRAREPWHCQAFEADPGQTAYAGGESFGQVQERVVPAMNRVIADSAAGNLAVVTHNIVARVYLAHLAGIPAGESRSIRLDNAGITVVALNAPNAQVITLNSVLHLSDGLLFD